MMGGDCRSPVCMMPRPCVHDALVCMMPRPCVHDAPYAVWPCPDHHGQKESVPLPGGHPRPPGPRGASGTDERGVP